MRIRAEHRIRVVTEPGRHDVDGDARRERQRDFMLALSDAADMKAPKPERKTAAPIRIATFEA